MIKYAEPDALWETNIMIANKMLIIYADVEKTW